MTSYYDVQMEIESTVGNNYIEYRWYDDLGMHSTSETHDVTPQVVLSARMTRIIEDDVIIYKWTDVNGYHENTIPLH